MNFHRTKIYTEEVNKNNNYNKIKILLIGDKYVGKTNILLQYIKNKFTYNSLVTIDILYKTKNLKLNNKNYSILIWDLPGHEKFRTITYKYYKGVDGIILVYDITKQSSYENINFWVQNIKKYAANDVKLILIGNKKDLTINRKISLNEGKLLATKLKIPFFETSAKNNINISNIFYILSTSIIDNKKGSNICYKLCNSFFNLFRKKR